MPTGNYDCSDASHEAYYSWIEDDGVESTNHVVHEVKSSIHRLAEQRRKFARENLDLKEQLVKRSDDWLKLRKRLDKLGRENYDLRDRLGKKGIALLESETEMRTYRGACDMLCNERDRLKAWAKRWKTACKMLRLGSQTVKYERVYYESRIKHLLTQLNRIKEVVSGR